MRFLLKVNLLLIPLLFSFQTHAQNEKALLWKISGNGLENPSYLFGTIHIICETDYFMPQPIEEKILEVESFYTELDLSDIQTMMEMQNISLSEKPLYQRITTEQYQYFNELLQKTYQMDIQEFENLSDVAIASYLSLKSFPCEQHRMYEVELFQIALSGGKKTGGLETVQEQFDMLSKSIDIEALISHLEEIVQFGYDNTLKMVALYKEQNIDGLLEIMNQTDYKDAEAYELLLVNRNRNWVQKLPVIMTHTSSFFAVGAAHLGGPDGLLSLLQKQGYQTTPIPFSIISPT